MAKSKKTKIHKKIDGQLLQMNKKFSNLKMKQKDKIIGWVYEEYKKYVTENEKTPDSAADEHIIDVICNLKYEIIYMNLAAVLNYSKYGGDKLIGRSLLDCHNTESREKIQQVVDWFAADESHNIVYTFHNEKQNKDVYMVALRDEGKLIGYYKKHEYRDAETMKQYDLW